MNDALRALLEDIHADGVRHDGALADRLLRRRNLEPDAAALLSVIIQAMGARTVVEVGTSNGYSTLWLADAVAGHGGRVLSIDLDADAQDRAAANLAAAGLSELVELRLGDGGEVLAGLPDGACDLLFLDSERPEYPGWWPHPVRVLRPGGLLAVDNVLSHPDEVAPLLRLIDDEPTLTSTVVPVGKGELLAVRSRS
ncbi:O-methyltransferase [Pseudonocardia acaciae]|uniref:O-methyltransferase n=1 Tax=Pseudonocardia acaciae TaxID=551276 RepID=UPI000490128A|nr:class I SAM-dependent methyltransferase [Pseudonocardia acaciae]